MVSAAVDCVACVLEFGCYVSLVLCAISSYTVGRALKPCGCLSSVSRALSSVVKSVV